MLASTFGSKAARIVVNILAVMVLVVQAYLFFRWELYTECVAQQATVAADRDRTIAQAIDVERAAERQLLLSPSEAKRIAVLNARARVDTVRASNPPPPGPETCD
jgi:hypothetical protein